MTKFTNKVNRSGNGLNLKQFDPCIGRDGLLIGGHSMKRVLSETLSCVGSGTASLASHYYHKRNARYLFFTKV